MIRRFKTLICMIGVFFALACSIVAFAMQNTPAKSAVVPAQKIKVYIHGVDASMKERIEKNLSLLQQKDYALNSSLKLRASFHEDIKQIKQVLKNRGYFEPVVHGAMYYQTHTHTWYITYTVTPGHALKITEIHYKIIGSGANSLNLKQLLKYSDLQVGRVLTTDRYDNFKKQVINTANDIGYLEAHWRTHQIRINLLQYTAVVDLTLSTGPEYTFGPVKFTQTRKRLSTSFLNRFVRFSSGAPYRQKQLNALRDSLNNSDYFASTDVLPSPDKASKTVPIEVRLDMQKPFQYSLGLGYGTATNLRAMLGFKWRFASETGQYLHALVQLSKIYRIYDVSYVIPGRHPLKDYTTLNIASTKTTVDTYTSKQLLAGVMWTHALNHRWLLEYGIAQHLIDFTTNAEPNTQHVKYLTPDFYVRYRRRFKQYGNYWESGYQIGLNGIGTFKNKVLSSQTFLQLGLDIKESWALGKNSRILLRQQGGYVATQHFNELAPDYRFYVGGLGTVRGINYLSLGPKNNQGNITGGKALLGGSLGFEQHLFGDFSAGPFYDAASAFNQTKQMTFYQSIGLGVAWRSPLGPLNLYLAHPLNDPGNNFGFDISLGKFI